MFHNFFICKFIKIYCTIYILYSSKFLWLNIFVNFMMNTKIFVTKFLDSSLYVVQVQNHEKLGKFIKIQDHRNLEEYSRQPIFIFKNGKCQLCLIIDSIVLLHSSDLIESLLDTMHRTGKELHCKLHVYCMIIM